MRRIPFLPVLVVAAACASEPLEPPATLVVTTTSLPDAAPNVAYRETVVATGGDGSYMWSIIAGSIPTSLSLDTGTGVIFGSPMGSGSTFTIQVVSGDGQTAAQQLTITVNDLLAVATSSVKSGVQAVAYSDTLSAIGGIGTYTWSLPGGPLPQGLTLNASTGEISGTPTRTGTTRFTVQVASGDGQTATQALAIAVISLYQSVTAGHNHSCGVTTAGAAYCWGDNRYGMLGGGSGTRSDSEFPVAVRGGLTFQSVDLGNWHNCGVTTAGAAYCWGYNAQGQLGDGTNSDSNVPVAVSGGLIFQSLTTGGGHNCGVTTAGAAYCWGSAGFGQLGDSTYADSNVPVAVSGGLTFRSLAAGGSHSCGVTTAGAAACWGWNGVGQLGHGTNTNSRVPVAVLGGLTFQSLTAGGGHSCGVTTAGAAYCWGSAGFGQLGDGTNSDSNVPVAVLGGLTFQSVRGVGLHTCGVTTTGAAYCWGYNFVSQLGDGTTSDSNVPVAVLGGLTFESVSAGDKHTCGLTTTQAAYCWGWNGVGQLGDGTKTQSKVPVLVLGP